VIGVRKVLERALNMIWNGIHQTFSYAVEVTVHTNRKYMH